MGDGQTLIRGNDSYVHVITIKSFITTNNNISHYHYHNIHNNIVLPLVSAIIIAVTFIAIIIIAVAMTAAAAAVAAAIANVAECLVTMISTLICNSNSLVSTQLN